MNKLKIFLITGLLAFPLTALPYKYTAKNSTNTQITVEFKTRAAAFCKGGYMTTLTLPQGDEQTATGSGFCRVEAMRITYTDALGTPQVITKDLGGLYKTSKWEISGDLNNRNSFSIRKM
jgi:hypothetical protein